MNQAIKISAQTRNVIATALFRYPELQLVPLAQLTSSADLKALGFPPSYNWSQIIGEMVKSGQLVREASVFLEYPNAKYGYRLSPEFRKLVAGGDFSSSGQVSAQYVPVKRNRDYSQPRRSYKLEDNIPLPPPANNDPNSMIGVAKRMEIGQSFLYGPSYPSSSGWRIKGRKFAVRKTPEGYRVWRTA